MEERKPSLFWIFIIIVGIFAYPTFFPNSDIVRLVKSDGLSEISCGSDSMGLSVSCKNNVRYHFVERTETLKLGDMYIYDNPIKEDAAVLHRLIGCLKVKDGALEERCEYDESFLIFKGDNNHVIDMPLKYNSELRLKKVDSINIK